MRFIASLMLFSLVCFNHANADVSFNKADVVVTPWDDLVPEGFSEDDLFDSIQIPDDLLDDQSQEAQMYMDKLQAALSSAPIVPELDKKLVKIPGFVVPVQSNGELVSEFFLVPYFGACIHVPPPPSNQIIYVYYEPGYKLESMYDPIWVTGLLETEGVYNDLAASGYSLTGYEIEIYEESEEEVQ